MDYPDDEFDCLAPECDNCKRLMFNGDDFVCSILGVRNQYDSWCAFVVPVELSQDIEYHDLSG